MPNDAWKQVFFSLSLHHAPRLLEAGLATHGVSGEKPPAPEHFRHRGGVWAVHGHTYNANLQMKGTQFPLTPGCVTLVAPETQMTFYFQRRSSHFYALFQLDEEGSTAFQTIHNLAAMQDLGAQFEVWNTSLGRVASLFALQPRRAEAILWTLLWELVEGTSSDEASLVLRARREIESRLGEPLSVAHLAQAHHLSHNQFTRVFRAATGETPSAYIARRRMERAYQLLIHTTRPVKSIAAETGFADVQALGKSLKRQFGKGPRALRARGISNPPGIAIS